MTAVRRENLAGLSGRVLEVGAGTGTNVAYYPDTVTEVVALEPEPRLAARARRMAPAGITVRDRTVEALQDNELFDAVVCSLVLCSVSDADYVVQQLFSRLKPGGQMRYLEHVAGMGVRGAVQRVADATMWPRLLGNCHTHRHIEITIRAAGFAVQTSRRVDVLPAWAPLLALGRAIRPV